MRTPEYGEVGPETRRTLDIMEDEYRAKLGLPAKVRGPSDQEIEALVALREKWSERNDR